MVSANFQDSLKVGQKFESEISELLSGTPVDMVMQKMGVDMVLPNGLMIECKHDKRAAKSGNFFAELVTGSKPGCLFTSQSDFIILKIGDNSDSYWVFKPCDFIRAYATSFSQSNLKVVQCVNPNGYTSSGMLIPLKKLSSFATQVSSTNLSKFLQLSVMRIAA
jgi:hypothetical protein